MPYYRHRASYNDIAPYVQKFRLWLRNNCPVVKGYEEFGQETFIMNEDNFRTSLEEYKQQLYLLQNTGVCQFIPFTASRRVGLLIINEKADGPVATVSPTHIRLPKLSHLITLTPNDFFGIMNIISNSTTTTDSKGLSINPALAGYDSIENSPLYPFFTKVRVNYRMNPDYVDKKWTRRSDIAFLSNLEVTRDNQLSAMQYLTAVQNAEDLLYFPAETVVQLELDWQQVTDDYCIPQL